MRRLSAILLSFLFSTVALAAGVTKSDVPENERPQLRGPAVIVEAARGLTDADRAELASHGLRIQQALSEGRYVARMTDDAAVGDDDRVLAIEPLTAERKIHASARRAVGRGRTWATLNVLFQRDVPFDEAVQAITQAGGTLDTFKLDFSPMRSITVKIPPVALDALAMDERVLTITGARKNWRVRTDNATSAAMSHVTEIQAAPYGLTGAGVTVSLFELAAAQENHIEFGGRLTVHALGGSSSDKLHATHTSGTIGAAGLRADAKGMAPAVTIHQFCVESNSNDCTNDWLEDKQTKLKPLGVSVDNNSWGYVLGWSPEGAFPVWVDLEEYYGSYEPDLAAASDEISNEQNILFVHSAGNDGDGASFGTEFSEHRHVDENGDTITDKTFCYSRNGSGTDCPTPGCASCETVPHDPKTPFDTMGATASAKNVIAVGAVGGSADVNASIAGFSSRGPAKDGRVKPELVARGVNVLSTVPTDSYGRQQGTSMSSPAVAGMAALLIEQWRRVFTGDPTPAELKALLIAGARDLGNPGPDYTHGFGLANAQASVDIIRDDAGQGTRIKTMSIAQGASQEMAVVVSTPQNFRAVLQWADPPVVFLGDDAFTKKALVNDLDLKVITPSGATVLPYVLDKDQYAANATQAVNNVDNTEMVEIPNAGAGTYRIVVTGTKVTEGPQTAVVVSSARAASICRDVQELTAANDTPETAHGNVVGGSSVNGAICTAGDVDFFKFTPTKTGAVAVAITAGDTPLRATLTGGGINVTVDIPANTTRTLNANATQAGVQLLLKIEATGTIGAAPNYTFV
ncbi:MAG: S8 family serine peptidase, partial [Thermoanaerobaculia bacterium]